MKKITFDRGSIEASTDRGSDAEIAAQLRQILLIPISTTPADLATLRLFDRIYDAVEAIMASRWELLFEDDAYAKFKSVFEGFNKWAPAKRRLILLCADAIAAAETIEVGEKQAPVAPPAPPE